MTNGKELALPMAQDNNPQHGVALTALPMAQVSNIAKVMAASGMFPDIAADGAKAFVKILAGQEMGIAPFEAMGGISIIAGKATIGGNIMAAKVKGSGKYDYKIKSRTNTGCTIEFFERNAKGVLESLGIETFDDKDATSAGLINKDMWKKYPKNMYFNRAISNGVRSYCPDVLGAGPVYTPEEMGAPVDEEGNAILAPGVTYAQDSNQQPIQSIGAGTPDNPPLDEAQHDDGQEDLDAKDSSVRNEGNPLELISADLLDKGFDRKEDRGLIALRFAGVEDFNSLTRDQWFAVYYRIVDARGEALEELLTPPVGAKDPEPEVEQPSEAVTNVFGEGVETVKPKKSVKPTGSQIATLTSLYLKKKLKTDKQKEEFNMSVIGKNHGVTADDYETLISAAEQL